MTAIGYTIAGLAGVEAAAGLLVWAGRRVGIRVADRKDFLRIQSEMLPRLLEPTRFARIHPVLGWTYAPNHESADHNLNSAALRSTREYSPEPPPTVKRISVYGDSFVFCNEVVDKDAWPAQIESRWDGEVLNFGVGGYGTDQALLRYRADGEAFKPEVVILGITSMMAPRLVSRYRRFQDSDDGPWFKPRFHLRGDQLEYVPSPITTTADVDRLLASPEAAIEFGKGDAWYEPQVFESPLYQASRAYRLAYHSMSRAYRRYWQRDGLFRRSMLNPDSEAFRILVRVAQDFAETARARGAEPAFLMLPSRADIELYRQQKHASYETLTERLRTMGVKVIDVASAMSDTGLPLDGVFANHHFNPVGNAIVANIVAREFGLRERTEPR